MRYIISCHQGSQSMMFDEFNYYQLQGTWTILDETAALFETKIPKETLLDIIMDYPLVFVSHLFEVLGEQDTFDLDHLHLKSSFSFQVRSSKDVREAVVSQRDVLIDDLKEQGYVLDIHHPNQIVNVFADTRHFFWGVETVKTQLSRWNAGVVRYNQKQEFISRSEFKLREAFDIFDFKVPKGIAVDLGAAPGGWSAVLASMGYDVHAIDPAKLDDKIRTLENVWHYRTAAQEYLSEHKDAHFALIVNDMKMNISKSISLTRAFARQLDMDGYVILTCKLPKYYSYGEVADCIKEVKDHFDLVYGRQLYHNRNEITVILKKKRY